MPSPNEKMIVLRRFDGVNLLVDQAYLGPSYLVQANNWIPGNTFRLTKMPGNLPFKGGTISGPVRFQKMIRAYDASGHRYLYAVVQPVTDGDQLWVSIDDGAWTTVLLSSGGNAMFTQHGAIYDMAILNGILYVGNGVDPIFSIPIGGTATALKSITAFTDGSAAPTLTSDTGSQILTGTYSYAWAIFDHTGNFWVERGQTRTVDISVSGSQSASFPTPTGFASNSGTLSTQFRAHLFIAPINLPVEFGHDHVPDGLSSAGAFVARFITADGPPLPLKGPARTGRIFRSHRGRLWIAGDQTNTTGTPGSGNNNANSTQAVWATYLAVPGLEQQVFNAGLFFPYNARTPRTFNEVTAIGTADTGGDDPQAPLIVCTLSETYLFYGDILDDPNAYWIRVSKIIGCISQETMVETPVGTIFVGLQSVYMIPPGGGPPVDVGWPIRPSIGQIPPASRGVCTAIYHKGFYKVAIVPPGATTATIQWWLDLRNGLGQVPSWWGPHKRAAVSTWCVGQQDSDEPDKGFMALDGTVTIGGTGVWDVSVWNVGTWASLFVPVEVIHQINSFVEAGGTSTIVSILQTGDLDDGRPFDRKNFTRVRATLFPGASTTLTVGVAVDGGAVGAFDAMTVSAPGGSTWNVDAWNVAQWGQNVISEGESVAPENRPRGRTGSVQLIHSQAVALSMRDFELRYLPVARPVRVLSTDPNS